ncbi:hypothetical protein [Sorangium sp. So ce1182]|uniref:hypothetical protein n=1 Tax=Sorangium sp. So ce1182 TaxID=3133334 RepID=UPI003F6288EC
MAEYVFSRLRELGFIEPAPDASARFELTRPVEALLRHLLREQHLSSAAVTQGYINDLELTSEQLEQAVQRRSRGVAIRVLDEIAAQMDRIRYDSRANRDSITTEVVRVRANAERRTPRERFEIVNRLWEHHLRPLRDLLDVDQAMERCLDRLTRLLVEGRTAFLSDGPLYQEFGRGQARLVRLRREVAEDLRECLAEVTPLYHGLQQDTLIVRGASEALRIARMDGVPALCLAQRFPLSTFRREGIVGDGKLQAYLHEVVHYEPPRPAPIPVGIPAPRPQPIDLATLRSALSDEPAPDDCLAWLIQRFPEATPTDILRAYGVFLERTFGRVEAAQDGENAYPMGKVTFHAIPMRLIPR